MNTEEQLAAATDRAEAAEKERDEARQENAELRKLDAYDIYNQLQTVKGELHETKVERDELTAQVALWVDALKANCSCVVTPETVQCDSCRVRHSLPAAARELIERVKDTEEELGMTRDERDRLQAENDGLKHFMECAKTPLMADVLAERDMWQKRATEAEAKCAPVEALLEKHPGPWQVCAKFETRFMRDANLHVICPVRSTHGIIHEIADALNAFSEAKP